MEIFWNTIASYNAATWPVQILLTLVAAVLTLLLYLRPTPGVRIAMKTFMALLNFWIAGSYTANNASTTTCWRSSGRSWGASGYTTWS
mgnify:CR=1 FL=1